MNLRQIMGIGGVLGILILGIACGGEGSSGGDVPYNFSLVDGAAGVDAAAMPDSAADTVPTDLPPLQDSGGPGVDTLPKQDTGGGLVCHEKLTSMYVMDKAKILYRFDPGKAEFTLIGAVDCGEFLDTTPGSMAVSREGAIYANYSSNELFELSIDDGACAPTSWASGTGGFDRFGMGFVTDGLQGEDVLYIAKDDALAALDTDTWAVETVGPLPSQCELTGNSLGELWGFFPLENPPVILQLDRTSAAPLTTHTLPPLPPDLDTFAFAGWGGDFYLFYRSYGMGSSSDVYRFDPETGLELILADSGMNIVGAGVSTCVPTAY
jgi:hypothetical protein